MAENNQEKFYKKKWFTILMLILFTPIGIILLWINKHWNKKVSVSLTVIFVFWFIFILSQSESPSPNETAIESLKNEQIEKKDTNNDDVKEEIVEEEKSRTDTKVKDKAKEVSKETKKTEEKNKENKKKQKEVKGNPKEKLKKAIEDEIRGELISFNGYFDKEPYTMQVEFKSDVSLTHNLTVESLKFDVIDIAYIAKESEYTFDNIKISAKLPLVDQYGNESDEYVIKSTFKNETLKKLADEKYMIDTDNLGIIADVWWEHPAIAKK